MLTIATKSGFELSKAAEAVVKTHCLNIDEMLKRAAICTLPEGNRRFNDWVFRVTDRVVVAITNVGVRVPAPQPTRPDAPKAHRAVAKQRIAVHGEVLTTAEFAMYETHELCAGEGCLGCDDGEVLVVRTLKKI